MVVCDSLGCQVITALLSIEDKKLRISRKCLKRYTSMVIHLKMELKENYSFEDGVKRVVLSALNGINCEYGGLFVPKTQDDRMIYYIYPIVQSYK
ncbi:hypothetical protein HanPSC8_Chr15g0673121 [Helianthus annuus]|nr:hypothetical protein HanPSC8_Chr15g0673121 [Helianthus annuus]